MHTRSIFLAAALSASCALLAQQQRQLFDDGWTFTQNGQTVSVNLPHDWDIYTAPDPEHGASGTGGGWYAGGVGEYRKQFPTPKGQLVRLHFEGVYQRATVFVNGQKAGQHAYGYTPFTIDVTPFLYKDKRLNEVMVSVDNSLQPNCRWYSGSGIYRHVWLHTLPACHIAENGVVVTTPSVSAAEAEVMVRVDMMNEGQGDAQVDDVEVTFSGDGAFTPATAPLQPAVLSAGATASRSLRFTVSRPRLWSPASPSLYQATVRMKSRGQVVDEQRVSFGIRSVQYSADGGFLLNGQPMLLNGACVHHDDGVVGAMAFDAAEIRKVRLMKQAGFNLIRTSHNPSTRAFLDACDSLGMLVIDEAFDGWRSSKTQYDYSTLIDSCYRQDLHAMVQRDRNHPCVIAWSIGNEVIERKELRVVTTARLMKQAILEQDSTRPVTEALCAWDRDWEIYDPHFEVLDIGGYNYMIFKHATDHQRDPQRVMWQTESYPRDAFRNWATVTDNSYVLGDMVWTGLDYLGESGIGRTYYEGERPGESYAPGGQPDWHGACCGDVDITGWRRPISHYRDMLWNGTEPLYMAVKEPDGYRGKIHETQWSVWPTWESWNWTGWEGKPIDVEVYTRAPEVRLYLNDKLVGTQAVSRATEFKAVFSVPYQPGTLRAEAAGHSFTLATAGEPARLRLTADRQLIAADGQDLAYVTVEVVDAQGRLCPDAAVSCSAAVKGQGQLLAFGSADLKDSEPYTTPTVTTWKGRAILVVRSAGRPGRISVSVKSQLPTANISIKTHKGR